MSVPSDSAKDRLIPWYFVMAFAVVFAVNGVFVYLATNTNRGVVTEHAYEKGLNYNETLDQARQERNLGWKSDITYHDGTLSVTLQDQHSAPISEAVVTASFNRPLGDSALATATLHPTDRPGNYAATVTFPQQGQWDVIIEATWNQNTQHTRKRIVVTYQPTAANQP